MNVSGKSTVSMIVNKCDEKNHAVQFPMRDCPWDFSYIDYGRESITVNGFRLGHQYDSSIPSGKVNLSAEVAKQLGVGPGSRINIVLHEVPTHDTNVDKVWQSNFVK
jgi:chromatin remodeling complex protein RSC6